MSRLLLAFACLCAGLAAQTPPAARKAPAAKPSVIPPAPRPPLTMPRVSAFTLANGLRVWLSPDREIPAVEGRLVFAAGSAYDPEGRTGLAQLTVNQFLNGGAGNRSPQDVRRLLAELAADVHFSVSPESATVNFWTLSDYAPNLLRLLADAAASPAFDRGSLFAAREQMRRAVPTRNDSLDDVAAREFTAAAFGPALAAPIELGGVDAMQREDAVDFQRRAYRPQTAFLVLSGDFDEAAMRPLLERTFGSWKPAAAAAPVHRPVAVLKAAALRSASTASSVNSVFQIGYPLENLSLDDHAALAILKQVLDGPGLQSVRRSSDPLAPSPIDALFAESHTYDTPGSFRIVGRARLRDTTEAVRSTLSALDKVRSGVSAADFASSRNRATQRLASEFAQPVRVLALYGAILPAPEPAQFVSQLETRIASISQDEFARAVTRLTDPARRAVAVAADVRDFRSPLSLLNLPTTTADMTIAPAPPEAPPTEAQRIRGAEQWQRMRTALGVDRRPIQDAEIHAKGVLFTGRSNSLDQRILWLAPSTIRIDQKNERETSAYYDGDSSWYHDGFRALPFNPAGVRQYRGEIFRFVHWLAARNLAPPLSVYYLGSGIIRVADGSNSVDIALQEKTGLPEALWYQDYVNNNSVPVRAEERMFDYKDYDGVPYWGRLELYRDGLLSGELDTVSASFNTGLTADQVARKPDRK